MAHSASSEHDDGAKPWIVRAWLDARNRCTVRRFASATVRLDERCTFFDEAVLKHVEGMLAESRRETKESMKRAREVLDAPPPGLPPAGRSNPPQPPSMHRPQPVPSLGLMLLLPHPPLTPGPVPPLVPPSGPRPAMGLQPPPLWLVPPLTPPLGRPPAGWLPPPLTPMPWLVAPAAPPVGPPPVRGRQQHPHQQASLPQRAQHGGGCGHHQHQHMG